MIQAAGEVERGVEFRKIEKNKNYVRFYPARNKNIDDACRVGRDSKNDLKNSSFVLNYLTVDVFGRPERQKKYPICRFLFNKKNKE